MVKEDEKLIIEDGVTVLEPYHLLTARQGNSLCPIRLKQLSIVHLKIVTT